MRTGDVVWSGGGGGLCLGVVTNDNGSFVVEYEGVKFPARVLERHYIHVEDISLPKPGDFFVLHGSEIYASDFIRGRKRRADEFIILPNFADQMLMAKLQFLTWIPSPDIF